MATQKDLLASLMHHRQPPSIPTRYRTIFIDSAEERAFNSTSKRFGYTNNDIPGPGEYDGKEHPGVVSTKGLGVGFASKARRFSKPSQQERAIGPGLYRPELAGDKLACSDGRGTGAFATPTGVPRKKTWSTKIPGPASYEITQAERRSSNSCGSYGQGASFVFKSKSSRMSQLEGDLKPIIKVIKNANCQPEPTMAMEAAARCEHEPTLWYRERRHLLEHGMPSGEDGDGFFPGNETHIPRNGPRTDFYDPDYSKKFSTRGKNAAIAAFKSTSKRLASDGTFDSTPGPASYNPIHTTMIKAKTNTSKRIVKSYCQDDLFSPQHQQRNVIAGMANVPSNASGAIIAKHLRNRGRAGGLQKDATPGPGSYNIPSALPAPPPPPLHYNHPALASNSHHTNGSMYGHASKPPLCPSPTTKTAFRNVVKPSHAIVRLHPSSRRQVGTQPTSLETAYVSWPNATEASCEEINREIERKRMSRRSAQKQHQHSKAQHQQHQRLMNALPPGASLKGGVMGSTGSMTKGGGFGYKAYPDATIASSVFVSETPRWGPAASKQMSQEGIGPAHYYPYESKPTNSYHLNINSKWVV